MLAFPRLAIAFRVINKTTVNVFLITDRKAMMLSDGRGAAFYLDPPRGYLEPYQSLEISVVAFNNMWGKYRDNFVVNVEGKN